ncbi:MAG TPA: ShlB/FhaC/HecB family hemolysin secretion/activation protein [Burkholderiales bacterium]|nr:ShlB/FhaC/HecB family hemolysin secretion/activation protein [Burkholderiales bacterium]
MGATLGEHKPTVPPTPAELVFPAEPRIMHDPNARRFTVNRFKLVGNTVFSDLVLQRLLEGYLDLQLNLYDLTKAADRITRFYRDHGYAVARAVIPAQKVENGTVRIEVIEGRIDKIMVAGNKRFPKSLVLSRTKDLADGSIVEMDRLERDLLLLNDIPGLTARAVLQPGEKFGTTDAVLNVREQPLQGDVTVDNYGRQEIGQTRVDATLSLNDPLGIGDQFGLEGLVSDSKLLRYQHFNYNLPVGSRGTRLGYDYSSVHYEVAGDFAALGVEGDIHTRELTLTHPIVRTRAENVIFSIGGRSSTLAQQALATPISDSRVNLMNLSLLYNRIHDDASITNAVLQFSSNFKDDDNGTRQNTEKGKLELDVNHLQPIGRDWDLYLRGDFVKSIQTLPDSEKFNLGGPDSVRGFRPAELRGDNGYLAQLELRRNFATGSVPGVVRLYGDAGQVENNAFPGSDELRSLGAGLSLFFKRHLTAKLDYAVPINNSAATDARNHGRLWASLGASF